MYRSEAMGEYFAAQSGMGAYAVPTYHQSGVPRHSKLRHLALLEHQRMHGVGEYFAANGLGADDVPMSDDDKKRLAMFAGGGAIVGLLLSVTLKKNKVAGAGLGIVAGLGAGYAMRPSADASTAP